MIHSLTASGRHGAESMRAQLSRFLRAFVQRSALADPVPEILTFPKQANALLAIPVNGSSQLISLHEFSRTQGVLHGYYRTRASALLADNVPVQQLYVPLRDPLDRARSCYIRKIEQARFRPGNLRHALGKQKFLLHYHDLKTRFNFEAYVVWLNTKSGSDAYADRHWMSQYAFLDDLPDGLKVRLVALSRYDWLVTQLLGARAAAADLDKRRWRSQADTPGAGETVSPALRDAITRRYPADSRLHAALEAQPDGVLELTGRDLHALARAS